MNQTHCLDLSTGHLISECCEELDRTSNNFPDDSSVDEDLPAIQGVQNPITFQTPVQGLNENTSGRQRADCANESKLRKNRKIDHAILLFCILFFMGFMLFKVSTLDRPDQMQTSSPYASPSTSAAPTTHYVDLLKEIFLPISGKASLEDPDSIQNFVFHKIAASMPTLVSESIVDVNNKNQIIQRYVQTVVQLSLLDDPAPVQEHILDNGVLFGPKCDRYICNEDDEITVVDIRNQWPTSRGRGTIAKEIGYLPKLTHILLSRNALRGTIPSEIGLLQNLVTLDIRGNNLTGTIPTELGLCKKIEFIFFYSNFLQGNIPSDVGKLKNLKYMDVSKNLLTGSIPERLTNCENLRGLALNNNKFRGNAQSLCDKNFTNEILVNEVVFKNRMKYSYTIKTSLIVDCVYKKPIVACSCCICV